MSDTPPGSEKFTIATPPKRAPGRPAGSKTAPDKRPTSQKPTTPTGDVKQAVAVLDSSYSMIALGLMSFGLSETANEWSERADTLRASNVESLTAAPKLAKMIAGVGTTGGAAAFLLAHTIAFGSVFAVGRAELAHKRDGQPAEPAQRQTPQRAPRAPRPTRAPRPPVDLVPPPIQTEDPTLIPGMPVPGVSAVK